MDCDYTEKRMMGIDLRILLSDFLRTAKHFLWLAVVLVLISSALYCLRTYRSYSPRYQATASFTVYVSNPLQAGIRNYNTATAEQMAKTFPYILTSGALSEKVMQELGISTIPKVTAVVLKNTNIFHLSVTSADPQLSYDVLNAVITYYPSIAEFVVGPTVMNLLDESGIPTEPINSRNDLTAVKKGIVIGLTLWLGAMLLLSLTRSTIHNEEDIKRLMNLRCIGVLPLCKGHRKGKRSASCPLLTRNADRFGFGESIRILRIRVEKELREHQKKVLLISSAIPGEGKTTTASNLALAFAQKGKRTLLVDCDLRNPSVAGIYGKENLPGLSNYLKGNLRISRIIHSMKTENLYIVAGGTHTDNAAELLTKQETKYFIDTVRNYFDYIILDTPPCSMLSDASEIAELADCALLAIRQDYASKSQILEGVQLLSGSGLPLIGCVLNAVTHRTMNGLYGY